jgi:NAD(P)-dependent dehydrogenase (short-subunit alcohol dehydrogenase family)
MNILDSLRPTPGLKVLVTAGASGIGAAIARGFCEAGARVHVCDIDRVALDRLATENPDITISMADASSERDVDLVFDDVRGTLGGLDVLVNNAGIGTNVPGGPQRQESVDGHELRFAVNYLAGYALTRRLLDLLERSAPARIVNVSSAGQAAIDFDDVMLERHYSGVQAYCQSKLAQILFTFDLAEELSGSGVVATCLHPATYMPTKIVPSPISSIQDGVDATWHLMTAPPDEVDGRYFNGLREARADAQAYDADARRALRELSERLTA